MERDAIRLLVMLAALTAQFGALAYLAMHRKDADGRPAVLAALIIAALVCWLVVIGLYIGA